LPEHDICSSRPWAFDDDALGKRSRLEARIESEAHDLQGISLVDHAGVHGESLTAHQALVPAANQLGIPADVASGHLAELLPQVIDKLIPGGAVPDSGSLDGLLGMLRK
jgi:hypothetical protein